LSPQQQQLLNSQKKKKRLQQGQGRPRLQERLQEQLQEQQRLCPSSQLGRPGLQRRQQW
jgi:hypothetical protein